MLETIIIFVLIAIVGALVIYATVTTFGHPALDGRYSRCPACAADTLRPLDAGHLRGRLDIYRCERCGKAYRAQLDGSLGEM